MSEQPGQTTDENDFPPDADSDQAADRGTEADEVTAGPAERNDPGNDSPATNAAVE